MGRTVYMRLIFQISFKHAKGCGSNTYLSLVTVGQPGTRNCCLQAYTHARTHTKIAVT